MKQFLLLPILLAVVASVRGASLVEGRIYLKTAPSSNVSGTTGCNYRKDSGN